jgi:hypothetical protein
LLAPPVGAAVEATQRSVDINERGHRGQRDGGSYLDPRLISRRSRACGLDGEVVELVYPEPPLLFESGAKLR